MSLKAGFISLGCAKNLVDTEVMLGILRQNGIEITETPAMADILIVNTCAFIQSATEESICTALNMAEYKESGRCKALIVAGCLAERYKKELPEELPEVDAFVGTGAYHRVMEAVEAALNGKRVVLTGDGDAVYDAGTPRILTTPGYTAYVKIAEGCDHRCAFCAIPLIRGKFRSRPQEDIVREVTNLTARGVKEINLVAQDTTNYGVDLYGHPALAELLKKLVGIKSPAWLRILYAYPRGLNDELLEVMASEPKICKYIDLPLQHASDSVLKRMRRPGTNEETEALLEKIRRKIPGVCLRSTFIVGFPGETEADFDMLQSFIMRQKFDKIGVFTFSREEGTPAYDLPEQVDEAVTGERYHKLMSLAGKISEDANESLVGRELDVLVEGRDMREDGIAYGRSYREAPEVDGQIYIEGDNESAPGDIVKVKITRGFVYDVVGERV